jgi:hypothetical protein
MGAVAMDAVTGFTGKVTGHARYITGSDQVRLTPPVDHAGKTQTEHWYDVERVEVVTAPPPGVGFRG